MLKSTYKPSGNVPPLLPPGWTEHKAPTGHTYYYHAETKQSTYTRPVPAAMDPAASAMAMHHQPVPRLNLSDPRVANAFIAQYSTPPSHVTRGGGSGFGTRGGRGGHDGGRPRPQPVDKPRSKVAIPGCEPWILVYTKYGRRFAYNPVKGASFWRIPERLKAGILELDQKRIQEKAGGGPSRDHGQDAAAGETAADKAQPDDEGVGQGEGEGHDYDSSEYEEVEVTDDEGEDDAGGGGGGGGDDEQDGNPSKRQRTEEPRSREEDGQPVEFSEADIAFQLQAMGEEYGLDPGEYDDGNMEEWPEGAEGVQISDEDARDLFKDLLGDLGTNPYSPWDKLLEDGRIIEDPRYTVLHTTKERKEVWEEWSRERIRALKEERARAEKKDPRISYMAFLQDKATPKLYWPEFRRKYKKEAGMSDRNLSDKDREKWYREHVARLKMPQPALKTDLTALLRSVPLRELNNKTPPSHLPAKVLTDLRYISLSPETRDPLIEAFIQTLDPPPRDGDGGAGQEDDEAMQKVRESRRKRELALQAREKAVAEEKRRKQRQLEHGKARLREEERELEKAMQVGKPGLQSQLAHGREKP